MSAVASATMSDAGWVAAYDTEQGTQTDAATWELERVPERPLLIVDLLVSPDGGSVFVGSTGQDLGDPTQSFDPARLFAQKIAP